MVPRLSTESSPSQTPSLDHVSDQSVDRQIGYWMTIIAAFLAEGCADQSTINRPIIGVHYAAPLEVEEKDPLLSDIPTGESLLGRMIRFSLPEGDVCMGAFVEDGVICIHMESKELGIPHSEYTVEYAAGKLGAYSVDDAIASMTDCLQCTKTDDGAKGTLDSSIVSVLQQIGVETEESIPADTIATIVENLVAKREILNQRGEVYVRIDGYTVAMKPKEDER